MNKVSLREKLGYGVGAVGLDLSYGLFYSYLSIYLTNALGISPAFLLIITPIARIWDGINDPMMGMIVDKTRTKMGKYRPWILTGALLNAIVLCLLFNNPGFDRAADIVRIRHIAKSHVSLSVTNLEQRGLLTRVYDPNDRRTAHLQLTDAAREITAEGARLQEQFFGCVFSGLSEEEMALWRSILQRVCANISNL